MLSNVVIVPGNGEGCSYSNFYPWLASQLRTLFPTLPIRLEPMPDPDTARESIWLPFITGELGANEGTLLIGHSSGAVAGMRLAETHKLSGLLLVSVTTNDLGDENERASGYYNRPWDWQAMRRNVPRIVQFASKDDPFIPLAVQREAKDGFEGVLAAAAAGEAEVGEFIYHELEKKSHFFDKKQLEVLEACRILIEKGGWGKVHGGVAKD